MGASDVDRMECLLIVPIHDRFVFRTSVEWTAGDRGSGVSGVESFSSVYESPPRMVLDGVYMLCFVEHFLLIDVVTNHSGGYSSGSMT